VYRHLSLIALLCLCTACAPATATLPAPTAAPAPTATLQPTDVPPPTPTLEPTASPAPQTQAFEYKVIFTDGSFSVREAYLGTNAIWKSNFKMPEARIRNTPPSMGLGRDMVCDAPPGATPHCSQTVEIKRGDGSTDKYLLSLGSIHGGAGNLYRNNRLVWSGYTNGANSFAILSSTRLGDEIALDYSKSNWNTGDGGRLWITPSILLSQGNTVKLIADAFAPQAIRGNLIYFRLYKTKAYVDFGGQVYGDGYDEVFNQLCCWHGPPLEITNNGEFIDFFGQRGSDWYHVQAGYIPGVK